MTDTTSATQDVVRAAIDSAGSIVLVQERYTGVYDFIGAGLRDGAWAETGYFGRLSGDAAAVVIGRLYMCCGAPMTIADADADSSAVLPGSGFAEFVRTRIAPCEWQSADEWPTAQRRMSAYCAANKW